MVRDQNGESRPTEERLQPTASISTRSVPPHLDWATITRQAAEIVHSYDTSVTLRQLFYRLVSTQVLPNTTSAYKGLSDKTAKARREGWFPDLIDRGRSIHRYRFFPNVKEARNWLANIYQLDHTKGQPWSIYIGVEKGGMVIQLQSWFGGLGVPILALGGYSSQSYVDTVAQDVNCVDRPAILLYAGDHDPSGEDIDRDFTERAGCFAKVIRIALSAEQVLEYDLPPNPGKETDSRAAGFIARHGELRQVELDALDPDDLRRLYQDAVNQFWDTAAFDAVMEQERADRSALGGSV
jgi:hypothetical protein